MVTLLDSLDDVDTIFASTKALLQDVSAGPAIW